MIPAITKPFQTQSYCANNQAMSNPMQSKIIVNSLPCDVFQRQKASPAFGSIPKKEIFEACDEVLRQIDNVTDYKKVSEISNDFFDKKLDYILETFQPSSDNEIDFHLFNNFDHELTNRFLFSCRIIGYPKHRSRDYFKEYAPNVKTDTDYLNFQKEELKRITKIMKQCTDRWSILHGWNQPDTIVSAQDVFELLERMPNEKEYKNISLSGENLIINKKIKNPVQFYTYVSQALGNAIKYGEGKPIKINIEEVIKNGKKEYYAIFTNEGTKTVPDEQIDKIVEGNYYRGTNAKNAGISGKGRGFYNIIKILKENGYEADIPYLIEKGRKDGFSVRIPLIGICD